MQRVRGVGRDLCIHPRGRQPLGSEFRNIGCVNQVVRGAGAIRIFREYRVQNGDRLGAIGQILYAHLCQRDE